MLRVGLDEMIDTILMWQLAWVGIKTGSRGKQLAPKLKNILWRPSGLLGCALFSPLLQVGVIDRRGCPIELSGSCLSLYLPWSPELVMTVHLPTPLNLTHWHVVSCLFDLNMNSNVKITIWGFRWSIRAGTISGLLRVGCSESLDSCHHHYLLFSNKLSTHNKNILHLLCVGLNKWDATCVCRHIFELWKEPG